MKLALPPASLLSLALLVSACADVPATATDSDSTATSSGTGTSTTAPSTVGPDPTSSGTTTGTSSTTGDPTSTTGTTTTGATAVDPSSTTDVSASSSSSGTTGMPPDCTPGEPLCVCLPGDFCNNGTPCILGECPPFSGQCPYELDGFCDEPDLCPPNTDLFDCCATQQNGICEELSGGGMCTKGTDWWDCGYCPWENDLECDEGIYCPFGSDPDDCCATPQNGVCEEMSQGGMCANGTDPWDCGFCPWQNDGWCDEPDLCPPGSDGNDCCATPQNGQCEEISQGGMCPDGSDHYDCGYCPWPDDGWCDEPDLCPPDSDNDCCATPQNGQCEEIGQGGMCPDGSDFYDCGYCPWENDFACDEPDLCPPGSDNADCCAIPENGMCEEIGQGGMCPDGSDFYDCGECPYANDGWCDEPFCPPGSDSNDCCAIPQNGQCEEIGQGGMCPDGTDFYDCGECPWPNDGWCDEPDLCPPGSDVDDCT